MQASQVTYHDGDATCHAYMAFDEHKTTPQPTVMIVHAFDGITQFIHDCAAKIVQAGYVAFCVDMFGDKKTANDFDSCFALIKPFLNDRLLLQKRILAGYEACKSQKIVDKNNIAAIGFCFGGMSVLDLARAGAHVKGVVSLHGVLKPPPENIPQGKFTAKVLILHGYDDPQVTPEQLPIIANELNAKQVDWQFVFFSHTKHSYTEPDAERIGGSQSGRQYNAISAKRAWNYMQQFFKEIFSV